MEEETKTEENIQNAGLHKNHFFDQPDNSNLDLSELAGRGSRLVASIIDSLILLVPNILVVFLYYGFDAYMENLRNNSYQFILTSLFIGLITNLLFNGYLLYKKGQTIGKMTMDIKIVDMNNNVPSLFRSFFLRSFLFSALYFIPFVKLVVMIDPFFIFSQSRRCLHDRFAGTKVVVADTDGE